MLHIEGSTSTRGGGGHIQAPWAPEEDRMKGTIAIVAPEGANLERLLDFAPDDVEVKRIDSSQPMDVKAEQMSDAAALFNAGAPFDMELVRRCPRLRLIQSTSAGVDGFDLAALAEMGVQVANNRGGNAITVAEHAVALMVAALRKLVLQFEAIRAGKWFGSVLEDWSSQAHEIAGKTVGILGIGFIGQEVARRLQGWGCSIIYYDTVHPPAEVVDELRLRSVSMDELLSESDILSLHVPLNPRTRGLIGARELGMMKRTAILINTCRGPVVDEAALIQALRDGVIAAAGLDVLEEEPTPSDNPLLSMDNVAVTPHLAAMSVESGPRSTAFAMENMARVARGGEPEGVVRPA